jgi:hypothetical protein
LVRAGGKPIVRNHRRNNSQKLVFCRRFPAFCVAGHFGDHVTIFVDGNSF